MTDKELKQKYCCRCVNSDEKFNCIAKQEAPFDTFICDNGEMYEEYEKEMYEEYEKEMQKEMMRDELRKEYEREMRGY